MRGGVYVWYMNIKKFYVSSGYGVGFATVNSPVDPGQVVHTHVPLFTKQCKLVPAQAGS